MCRTCINEVWQENEVCNECAAEKYFYEREKEKENA